MYSAHQRRSASAYATPAADQFDIGQVEQAGRLNVVQRLHTLMRRIVEVAHFTGGGVGFAWVQIRGGVVLVIPLDKASPGRAGYRKTWA